ncbi:hypothetical protein GCM10023075_62260 [Streptosporangium album]
MQQVLLLVVAQHPGGDAGAPGQLIFVARLLAGVMGGTLWAMLAGYAARMAPAERRGRTV